MRFNLEPKRCKSVSLSAKRSVFTLVGLAHGVVTEKLRFPYNQPPRGPVLNLGFDVSQYVFLKFVRISIGRGHRRLGLFDDLNPGHLVCCYLSHVALRQGRFNDDDAACESACVSVYSSPSTVPTSLHLQPQWHWNAIKIASKTDLAVADSLLHQSNGVTHTVYHLLLFLVLQKTHTRTDIDTPQ